MFKASRVADASGKQVWTFGVWKNIRSADQSSRRKEPSIGVVAINVGAPVLSFEEQWGGSGASGPGWKKRMFHSRLSRKRRKRDTRKRRNPQQIRREPPNPSVCLIRIKGAGVILAVSLYSKGYITSPCITFPLDWNSNIYFLSVFNMEHKGFWRMTMNVSLPPFPALELIVSCKHNTQEFFHFKEKECWIVANPYPQC